MDRKYVSKSGRAFSSDATNQGYRAIVAEDGTVRVWDRVAKHYTTCHSLTPRQIANILRSAV
jgi:hypothetical protein